MLTLEQKINPSLKNMYLSHIIFQQINYTLNIFSMLLMPHWVCSFTNVPGVSQISYIIGQSCFSDSPPQGPWKCPHGLLKSRSSVRFETLSWLSRSKDAQSVPGKRFIDAQLSFFYSLFYQNLLSFSVNTAAAISPQCERLFLRFK